MVRAPLVPTVVMVAAGCGADKSVVVRQAPAHASDLRPFYGLVECPAAAVTVSYDPRTRVSVDAEGSTLASATFDERLVSARCDVARKGRWIEAEGGYADAGVGEPIRERVVLRCEPPPPLAIDVHPIYGGTEAVILGSNLLVLSGPERDIVLSAVLKDEGAPQASRIFHAAPHCSPA